MECKSRPIGDFKILIFPEGGQLGAKFLILMIEIMSYQFQNRKAATPRASIPIQIGMLAEPFADGLHVKFGYMSDPTIVVRCGLQ